MRKLITAGLLLGLAVGLASCRTALPFMPADAPQKGALLLAIESKPLLFAQAFDKIWIARIDDGLKSDTIIASNWHHANRQYFLGLAPGKYAVVATFHKGQSTSSSSNVGGGVSVGVSSNPVFHTFPNEASMKRMIVDVQPGKLTIGGYYLMRIGSSISAKNAKSVGEVVRHYVSKQKPSALTSTGFLGLGNTGAFQSSIMTAKNDEGTKAGLLAEARKDLGASPWKFLLK